MVSEVGAARQGHLVEAYERRQAGGRDQEHEADAGSGQGAEARERAGAGSAQGGAHGVASFFVSGAAFFVAVLSGVP